MADARGTSAGDSSARVSILARIREQLGTVRNDSGQIERDYLAISRDYTRAGSLEAEALEALLLERLADYDAEVVRVHQSQIARAVGEVLRRDDESILLVPLSIPEAWFPDGVEVLRDGDASGPGRQESALSNEALSAAHAVLTTCVGAVAETGTLLLEHSAAAGRRALTLLPDHHLCVLRKDQIVETVSEGLALLAGMESVAITTISGPSATADIEMTRIRGVHGPRRLTVLLA